MPQTLTWRGGIIGPVDGAGLRPDRGGDTPGGLARRSIRVGNRDAAWGDLFDIAGDGGDGQLILVGDLGSVHDLGAGMASGRLEVRGDVGHRLGVGMRGGEIEVDGSAGAGAGADLVGGLIRIRGDAGDDLGAALPGGRVGVRGGTILVHGSAGAGVGTAMRRGLIAVLGSVGGGAGRGRVAGSIFVGGTAGSGLGAGMKRGTIALLGDGPEPGPTFEPSGGLRPVVATLYLRQLVARGWPVPAGVSTGPLRRYNGDRAVGGQGEVWHFGGLMGEPA